MKVLQIGEVIERDFFSGRMTDDSLIISLGNSRAISNAPLNGGMKKANNIINYSLYNKKDCENLPIEYLRKVILGKNLDPSNTIGLLTAVRPDKFILSEEDFVSSFISVGVDNLASPLDGLKYSGVGTINIVVLTKVKLTGEASVDAFKTSVEAKSYSLWSMNARSQFSGKMATGTITDVTAIVSNERGEEFKYAGTGTDIGTSISMSIYSGIVYALSEFYGYENGTKR